MINSATDIDDRALVCIEILIQKGIVDSWQQFCFKIEMFPQNINGIKNGKRHFTLSQLYSMVHIFNINPSYLFGVARKKFLE